MLSFTMPDFSQEYNVLLKAYNELKSNVPIKGRFPTISRKAYNCWGFVSYMYGWIDEVKIVYSSDMENYLEKFTYEVNTLCAGDILVYRGYNRKVIHGNFLTHTALVFDERCNIIHKPGSLLLEKTTIPLLNEHHGEVYGCLCDIRRVI